TTCTNWSSEAKTTGRSSTSGLNPASHAHPGSGADCQPGRRPTEPLISMTTEQALAFIESHGVVLESSRGPVPNVAMAIAGEPIRGSWWGHPEGHAIYRLTRAVRAAPEVLVCRLVDGKVTYVHRRLWPALVRMAWRFPR